MAATNKVTTREVTSGDFATAMPYTLKQGDTAVDLTSKTVEFLMINASGGSVIALTGTGVVGDGVSTGQVSYTFSTAIPKGTYFGFFVVTTTATGFIDTFPHDGNKLKIVINPAPATGL